MQIENVSDMNSPKGNNEVINIDSLNITTT